MCDNRNTEKLREFSEKHLIYELWMFKKLAGVFIDKRLKIASDDPDLKKAVNYAMIESFVIHSRNLMDFFYRDSGDKDDVYASLYFEDMSRWAVIRPVDETGLLDKIRKRANKEVTHLTFARLDIKESEKGWDKIAEQYFSLISRTLELFIRNASPKYLANNVVTFAQMR